MLKHVILFNLFLLVSSSLFASRLKLSKLSPLHEQEISTSVEVQLNKNELKKLGENWRSCIPQESQKFPKELSSELKKQIFTSKELNDLRACKPGSCKHNFLPYELELISKIKDPEKLKEQFFSFYRNRVKGLTPMSPQKHDMRFHYDEALSPRCASKELKALIDHRPQESADYRLSVVRYDSKMRPTTRLLQAKFFENKNELCYAEALVFSNHYDLDRFEIWYLDQSSGQMGLLVRHRIDLLNSWWRRLQKPKLQQALEAAIQQQAEAALQCALGDN